MPKSTRWIFQRMRSPSPRAMSAITGWSDRAHAVTAAICSSRWATSATTSIISNPPYVDAEGMADLPRECRAEPKLAFDGGADGLDIVRRILDEAEAHLTPQGGLLCEDRPLPPATRGRLSATAAALARHRGFRGRGILDRRGRSLIGLREYRARRRSRLANGEMIEVIKALRAERPNAAAGTFEDGVHPCWTRALPLEDSRQTCAREQSCARTGCRLHLEPGQIQEGSYPRGRTRQAPRTMTLLHRRRAKIDRRRLGHVVPTSRPRPHRDFVGVYCWIAGRRRFGVSARSARSGLLRRSAQALRRLREPHRRAGATMASTTCFFCNSGSEAADTALGSALAAAPDTGGLWFWLALSAPDWPQTRLSRRSRLTTEQQKWAVIVGNRTMVGDAAWPASATLQVTVHRDTHGRLMPGARA